MNSKNCEKNRFTKYQKWDTIVSKKTHGGADMIIKASASLRNEYTSISNIAKKTKEPIYITKNGEGDGRFKKD